MTQRRVLITGAGGFVGEALALGFADLGWQVVGVDRQVDPGREDRGIRWLAAELSRGVPGEVGRVDVVVHGAWMTTDPEALGITTAEHVALNLHPLMTVLEYAARTGPDAFVFLSSSGVFESADAVEGLTDSDHPTGTSAYAVGKRAGEFLVPATLASDTAVHVVRLGYLFGPGEVARPSRSRVSLVAGWLAAAQNGEPMVVRSDDPARDWTFTPDLAAALERVLGGSAVGHPVHLGSPHVCRDRALADLIASLVPGAEVVEVPGPGRVKPPMVASDIPTLDDFVWTDPASGLRTLLNEEVAT